MVGTVATINTIFGSYYDLLGLALVILVPIWFSQFVIEALATILTRWRERHD